MLRLILAAAIATTIGAAFALYSSSLETRQIALRAASLERKLERLEADIAVLRAERAHLARPQRIEELARSQGLVVPPPGPMARIDSAPAGAVSTAVK